MAIHREVFGGCLQGEGSPIIYSSYHTLSYIHECSFGGTRLVLFCQLLPGQKLKPLFTKALSDLLIFGLFG
jgi:hypothetical protein